MPVAALTVAILVLIGRPIIARAATIEEVARCRAIQSSKQRWECFRSLKAKRQHAPPSRQAEPETAPDEPATKHVPPSHRAEPETAPDEPATTSSIGRDEPSHLSAAPGQPLCVDQDSLAAALMAGVLASSPTQVTTNGCQTIPKNAQVQLLQRFPSGFDFLRVVKVKVTFPTQSNSTVGYTVEIGR